MSGKSAKHDVWASGESYERYMGRWSRQIAARFLDWLDAPKGLDWADVGCGTGALTQTILSARAPRSVVGIEPSEGFVSHARSTITDELAEFRAGGAEDLPLDDDAVDVVASALVLNFVPDRVRALKEMQRVTRPGGIVSFYVWDYPGGGMGFIDAFWKAAAERDPKAAELDESERFPFCTKEGLAALCGEAGVVDAEVRAIEIPTVFPTFADFWQPFTLGVGPAPAYYASLSEEEKTELHRTLARRIGIGEPIELVARAWAVKAGV